MEFTGERFVPGVRGVIEIEHVHRYLYASRIAAGKVILDIACGEGYGSALLAAHATRVIGVDISPEVIEHAQSRYQRTNLEFRVGTCADFPLDDASVDLVVSFETLEHHDQHDRMMEEIKRVLRPRGLLLLSSPDKLHYTIEPGRLNPYHVKELYKQEFEDLLSKYFANTAYFAQRVLYGSGIFSSESSTHVSSYQLSREIVKESAGLSDPNYWIAFASDDVLPELTSSVLEQPIDESEVLLQLKQALSERERQEDHLTEGIFNRDGQIAILNQNVVERDARIADLTREVGDRDGQIAILSKNIVERDTRIADISKGIGVRDGQIASLSQNIVDRDGQIAILGQKIIERDARIEQLKQIEAQVQEQQHWQDSLLRAAEFTPLSLHFPNAWVGHLAFAAWLIDTLAPEIFVELGTHSGNSFFTFCQAVAKSGNSTRCYAVDTWQGDEHAGEYDESIFTSVSAYQQQHYRKFSRLLRMTFNEARDYFSDGSVNLLHIDGLHTYEAVRMDFESWLPKLAPGAVVLFHDTNVRERNFGVWKLWEELREAYPLSLEFAHSHGLGVLQLNNAPERSRLPWLEQNSPQKEKVIDFFTSLGTRHLDLAEAVELREHISKFNRMWAEQNEHIVYRDGQIAHLNHVVADRDSQIARGNAQIAGLNRSLAERYEEIDQFTFSRSWRFTSPMRKIGRWMRGTSQAGAERNGETGGEKNAGNTDPKGSLELLFDAGWYLKQNPDIRAAGMDPLEHFAQRGGKEGRSPHPLLDVQWYLRRNPDVYSAGVNPLDHFLNIGWKEKRSPHPLFDVQWYLESNPDVSEAGVNPLLHFIQYGGAEGRKPHPLFDARWYLAKNPDVRAAGVNPLMHFLENGWAEGRSPSPDFDLPWYLDTYADVRTSGVNPLIHYVEFGAAEGRRCKPEIAGLSAAQAETAAGTVPVSIMDIAQYLPQGIPALLPPSDITVDIIVPVYRGFEETRRCITSLLSDTDRPNGLIRVIDDCSPDPELSAWLSSLAASGEIQLSRNSENLGFVRTVNRGMTDAAQHDVVLLNSDTEVPVGLIRRLAGQAYSKPNVASVTPYSNTGGEMAGFPDKICRPLPSAYSLTAIDKACEQANGQRSIEIPTGVGFCLYIRRACLDEIGLFDADTFGRGYGEETDFCQRALAKGWCHLLACNAFVYHVGEVSFGENVPERASSWNKLVDRYPELPPMLNSYLAGHPTVPPVFAATASLFHESPLPTVLAVNHNGFDDENLNLIDDLTSRTEETTNVLGLRVVDSYLELSVPSIPGHPTLRFPCAAICDLQKYLLACSVSRIHIQHTIGIGPVLHELVDRLSVPVDLTVQDHLSA